MINNYSTRKLQDRKYNKVDHLKLSNLYYKYYNPNQHQNSKYMKYIHYEVHQNNCDKYCRLHLYNKSNYKYHIMGK